MTIEAALRLTLTTRPLPAASSPRVASPR
jgi:hypothetical protein